MHAGPEIGRSDGATAVLARSAGVGENHKMVRVVVVVVYTTEKKKIVSLSVCACLSLCVCCVCRVHAPPRPLH